MNTASFSINDVEIIIKRAFQQAQYIVRNSSLTKTLRNNGLDDLNSLSSFIVEKKKSISTDYSSLNSQLTDEGDSSEDDSQRL